MAYGLADAPRKELKGKQLLPLHMEPRSNRLNRSGMNKIVASSSATPCSIKRSNVRVQTCNRCIDSACCRTRGLTDISHWDQSLHDRIPRRRALQSSSGLILQ